MSYNLTSIRLNHRAEIGVLLILQCQLITPRSAPNSCSHLLPPRWWPQGCNSHQPSQHNQVTGLNQCLFSSKRRVTIRPAPAGRIKTQRNKQIDLADVMCAAHVHMCPLSGLWPAACRGFPQVVQSGWNPPQGGGPPSAPGQCNKKGESFDDSPIYMERSCYEALRI
jgi:hypothetical protein